MYFPAPPSSSKQIIVSLKRTSMLPHNKRRLIIGRLAVSWHWTLCCSLLLPSKHFWFPKTYSRRFEDVSKTCLQNVFHKCLEDVFKMSSRRLRETYSRRVCKTFSKRFQDVFMKMSCSYVLKTSWKRKKCYTEDVFSMSSWKRMFSGWVYPSISRTLQCNSSPQAFPAPLPTCLWVYGRQYLTNIIIVNMVKVSLGHSSTSQTSQKTVCRQYVKSTSTNMHHCMRVRRSLTLTTDAQGILLMRCCLFACVLSSIKLTNQWNYASQLSSR